jgi:L-fuconolactonase
VNIVDAHQHFWRIAENDCTWPGADLPAIYRHFERADLRPLLEQNGVTASVLVQSQPSDTDTDYLLAIASATDFVKAVVGWVDLASLHAAQRIRALATHPKMRGLRPMLQGLADDNWLLRPELDPAIEEMLNQRLKFDALILPKHLPVLAQFVARYPDLPVVIDHAAKPAIAQNGFDTWARAIEVFATTPNVFCKLSGLVTESAVDQDADALQPYVTHLLQVFGAQRLMWGSDWPVVNIAANPRYASYDAWLQLTNELLPATTVSEREHIFAQTAQRFYRFAIA